MHKRILTIALLLILPLFTTACTLSDLPVIGKFFGPSLSKAITVSVWGMWEEVEVMDALIAKYKETHPNVTIVYDNRSIQKSDQYRETLYTRLTQDNASEGDLADIVIVHQSWVPRLKDTLYPAPSAVMDQNYYNSTFYRSAATDAVLDGKVYASPVYFEGLALVYNKRHFAEIDQETAPTAWEEFRRLALRLTQKDKDGNFIRAGAAIGTSNNVEFFSDIIGLLLAQAGVPFPSGIDSDDARDAVKFFTNFVTEDGVWSESMPEAATAFAQERASMIFVPSWNLLDIIRARPDLDIGVAPVPQADPSNPVSWASSWMYAVPQKSKNKDAAWDFIKFLSTQEAQRLMFSTASQYRTYGAPFSNSTLREEISSGTASKYVKPYLDTAPFSRSSLLAARVGNTNTIAVMREAISSMVVLEEEKRAEISEVLKGVKEKLTGVPSTQAPAN